MYEHCILFERGRRCLNGLSPKKLKSIRSGKVGTLDVIDRSTASADILRGRQTFRLRFIPDTF